MAIEEGARAKLIQPTIEGEIKDTQWNKASKCPEHLLAWTDAEGETHERWFLESELEEVK